MKEQTNPQQLQKDFLAKIAADNNIKNADFIKLLMDLFNIGKDAAYKRNRGHTLMPIHELVLIAKRFNFSFDEFLNITNNSSVIQLPPDIYSYEDYLAPLAEELQQTMQCKQRNIWYSAQELPSFYYFYYPDLASFKLFFWGVVSWEIEGHEAQGFSIDNKLPKKILNLIDKMNAFYLSTPSTEFWHSEILINTYRQIILSLECNFFNKPSDALQLLEELKELWKHLQLTIDSGKKFHPGLRANSTQADICIYNTNILYPENFSLLQTEYGDCAFHSIKYPNLVKNYTVQYCQKIEESFKTLTRYSQILSGSSYKATKLFKQKISKQIYSLEKKIIKLVKQKNNEKKAVA